jgi:hypothetical protein
VRCGVSARRLYKSKRVVVVWLPAALLREPWVSFLTMTRVVSRLEFPELPSARGGDLRDVVPAILISPTADWPSR